MERIGHELFGRQSELFEIENESRKVQGQRIVQSTRNRFGRVRFEIPYGRRDGCDRFDQRQNENGVVFPSRRHSSRKLSGVNSGKLSVVLRIGRMTHPKSQFNDRNLSIDRKLGDRPDSFDTKNFIARIQQHERFDDRDHARGDSSRRSDNPDVCRRRRLHVNPSDRHRSGMIRAYEFGNHVPHGTSGYRQGVRIL